MRMLKKNKDEFEESMIVAENEHEFNILQYLYDANIIFGSYKIYNRYKSKDNKMRLFMEKYFPTSYGAMFISVVRDFVKGNKEEI